MIQRLLEELRPQPFRTARAVRLSTMAILSLGISLFADVTSAFGAFSAVICINPDVSHTWRLLLRRLTVMLAIMIVGVPLVGVLVQLPWFAIPAVFVILAVGGSLLPQDRFLLEWLAVKFTVVALLFGAQFDPDALGTTAATLFWALAIPLTTATAFSRLVWPEGPRELLDASLSTSFEKIHESLGRTRKTLGGAVQPHQPVRSELARHLALIDRLGRISGDPDRDRFYSSIAVLVDRAAYDAGRLEFLATRLGEGRTYVESAREEIFAMLRALEEAVAAFAAHFDRSAPPLATSSWPDLHDLMERLDARRDALRSSGSWYDDLGVAIVARLNDAFEAMRTLSDRFRDSPAAFRTLVAPATSPSAASAPRPLLEPARTRFSIRAAAASTCAYVVASATQHPQLETSIWTTLHAAQFTHGATVRKMLLRAGGSVLGGMIAIVWMNVVLPNTTDVGIYLLSIFVVLLPMYYIGLGGPRLAYLGTQGMISFLLAYLALTQVSSVGEPLWRVFAIVLGDLLLYGTFRALGPELASTKIGPVLTRMDQALSRLLPDHAHPLSLETEEALARDVTTDLDTAATLADEVRFEGGPQAMACQDILEYVALNRRVLGRLQAVHDVRRTARDELPSHVRDGILRLERALAARFAVPGSSERPASPPDLESPLAALREEFEAARPWIAALPAERSSRVYSELDQYSRLVSLSDRRDEVSGRLSRHRAQPSP